MFATPSSRHARHRSTVASLAVGLLVVTASACGSDPDSDSDDAAGPDTAADTAVSVAVTDPADSADPPAETVDTTPVESGAADTAPTDTAPTDTALTDTAPAAGSVPEPDGGGEASAMCGGLSAADVGAAVGAEFDSAADSSIEPQQTCLFSSSTATDGVTVMTQPAETYLGGMLAGLPAEEALAQLAIAQTTVLDDGYVVEQTTIGESPAVIVTGTNAMVAIPTGYASTVVDGVVIEVTLDGTNFAPDPAGLGPLASAVLELAVGTQA